MVQPMKIVETKNKYVDLTVDAGVYAAGDNVGGLLTFDVHSVGGAGRITQISLFDDDNLQSAMDVHIYHEKPTVFVNNAAFAPTIVDLKKEVQKVAIVAGDYDEQNSNAVAHKNDLTIDYTCDDGGNLYFNLVSPGGVTPTSTSAFTLRVYYLAN